MPFIFNVKVTPSSGKSRWSMDKSGNLKCYVKSPAEGGKANAELIKNLAKALNITQSMITIVAGELSRKKRIKIDVDITFDILLQLLGVDWQMDMF